MERRMGFRAQVDLPVSAWVDGHWHNCRVIDLSPTGMVVERTLSLAQRPTRSLNRMSLYRLGDQPIAMRARTVWSQGRYQAVRFVLIDDADRLTIAEHLDRKDRLREPLH